jgi:hypothetical protein
MVQPPRAVEQKGRQNKLKKIFSALRKFNLVSEIKENSITVWDFSFYAQRCGHCDYSPRAPEKKQ